MFEIQFDPNAVCALFGLRYKKGFRSERFIISVKSKIHVTIFFPSVITLQLMCSVKLYCHSMQSVKISLVQVTKI